MSKSVYLRGDVVPEPLFNQWYAWPYLIPPASAAMFIANAHLKIMQSFVAAPQVHVSALKNPAMMGGPFISHGPEKVPEIRELIDRTTTQCRPLLELADAVKTLDSMLVSDATGFSMEALYPRVPDSLRGYVELVYDLRDNPSIRFIEGLLYNSKYYDTGLQSVMLRRVEGDERSFVFSTPRLAADGALNLSVPFASDALALLFSARGTPQEYEMLRDALGVDGDDEPLFRTFFTEVPAEAKPRFDGDGVRVRYLGHACVLVETRDVSILCDPVVGYPHGTGIDRYTFADLPPVIDYVLITHNHQDHVLFETLLQLRHRIRNVVVPKGSGSDRMDPSLKLILRAVGFRSVVELDELEQVALPGGAITGLPFLGEHADLNIRAKLAYHVELLGNSLLMAADSNNVEPRLYEHLRDLIADVDILFIGMECDGAPMSWLYGPLLTRPAVRRNDQSRRFDGSTFEKGIEIVNLFRPGEVYVYAMGQEPWCSFLTSLQYTDESRPIVESNRLVAECESRGITAERLYGRKELMLSARDRRAHAAVR